MYMDDIKLFAKNRKKLKALMRIYRQDKRNGNWHRKMCHANNEKREE